MQSFEGKKIHNESSLFVFSLYNVDQPRFKFVSQLDRVAYPLKVKQLCKTNF